MKRRGKLYNSQPDGLAGSRGLSERARNLVAAFSLCFLALLAFANSFDAGLTLDSAGLILKDPRIHQVTAANFRQILAAGEAGLYRPFATLSFLFNYAVLGNHENPAGYHWINFLLHAGNVVLLFTLAQRLLSRYWPSVAIAALWAVHPVLTEAVTNIAGRADLLAAMAVLGGFLMYLKSTETTGPRRIGWLGGLVAATAIGVFSKESAISIVGVIALYEFFYWQERRRGEALVTGCLATLVPVAVMLYRRSAMLAAEIPFVDNPITGAGFWLGRLTAIKVIARYLRVFIWPSSLSVDYSYPEIPLVHGGLEDWAGWAAVAIVIAAVVVLRRHSRTSFFFACFAAVVFLPASNLLFTTGTIMAERSLYLPAAGLTGCVVMAIYAVAQRVGGTRFVPVLFCVIGLALAVRTWARNADWQDDLTISSASLQASPNSFKLHRQLAAALYASDPRHGNIQDVADEGGRSVALLESLPDSLNNRDTWRLAGGYYLVLGDLQRMTGAEDSRAERDKPAPDSAAAYRRASEILLRCIAIGQSYRAATPRPDAGDGDAEPYQLLAAAWLRLGDAPKALGATRQALAMAPRRPEVYRQIAATFFQHSRVDDAAVALAQGVLLTSDAGLEKQLLSLYQGDAYANSCALTAGTEGPAGASINRGCMRVREHFCAASVAVLRSHLRAGRRDLAEQQQKKALSDYGCPVQSLDEMAR